MSNLEKLSEAIREIVRDEVREAIQNQNKMRVTPADYRIRKGFKNVETLAVASGVDRRLIHRAERGQIRKYQETTTMKLAAVANELGVNPNEYLKAVRDHSEANRK